MKKKKTPLRKCIGCQEMKPKRELIRIVSNKEGEIHLDDTGKAHGRGAYICPDQECFEKVRKTRGLNRSFDKEVPDEVYQDLKSKLNNGETS